ncbi:hypothetical protein ETD86_20395 [Nonomuraea turkmeniaca]|uniref:Uncharacterized protein n=1 Tax=Nonomuraea turkmeniaca TaxID=103838 RepID=A0A5S4FH02_9ACTN|nr:hypothetical protein [Nonomuraea turkmeniaca]TMR19228.1 hypothetical protein ETD86_20395 [Nonomuraea turkmeniaca]
MDHVQELRKSGVWWRSYLSAGRHLMHLALPGLLVYVPLAVFSLLVLGVVLGDSAVLVNGRLEVVPDFHATLLIVTGGLLVLWVVAQAVVFAATVILAAGRLVGRPASNVAALRAAVRRLPALLFLVVAAVLGSGAAIAAGLGVLALIEWEGTATTVMVALVLVAVMPGVLAVPSVLLHDCTAPGSIRHAYRLGELRMPATALTLAFGVVIVPAAVTWAVEQGVSRLPDALVTVAWSLAGPALVLAVTPFQAAVVARQFLHCMAWRTEVDDEVLATGLPDSPPRSVEPRLWAVSALPGLLFSGIVLVNPFGWLEVAETKVTAWWKAPDVPASSVNHGYRRLELRDVHPGRGQGLIVVADGWEHNTSLLACPDVSCRATSFSWVRPPGPDPEAIPSTASARLPDGRLLLTAWTRDMLRLLTCEADRCVPAPGAAPIAVSPYRTGLALAVRKGGGLVFALSEEEQVKGPTSPVEDVVSFIFCPDVSCSRPRARQVARLDKSAYFPDPHHLAVTMAPDDRPVAARYNHNTGQIHVITCADAECLRPRVASPVPHHPWSRYDLRGPDTGLALAVRADGRPVIAYRDQKDGAAKLLDCRTPDCAQADVITLAAGDWFHTTPALVLDRAGRVLVAYEDQDRAWLMLATCTDGRCESTAVTRAPSSGALAMTLNSQGRPTITWIDDSPSSSEEWALIVTTPLTLSP